MQPSIIHNTFVIERSYPVSPERVFAAFSDPEKKRRWYPGSSANDPRFAMDFRPGGKETSSSRLGDNTPFPGALLTNDGIFLTIVPDRQIVIASEMTLAGKTISDSMVTFEFLPADKGTDLIFTHQAAFFEGSGGPEMREGGWRILLGQLDAELAR